MDEIRDRYGNELKVNDYIKYYINKTILYEKIIELIDNSNFCGISTTCWTYSAKICGQLVEKASEEDVVVHNLSK